MRKRRDDTSKRNGLLLRGLVYGTLAFLIFAAAASGDPAGDGVSLRDIAFVEGRPVMVSGFGLVVGLKGTGDGSVIRHTDRSLAAALTHLGIEPHEQPIKVGEVAAVLVQAHLSPGVDAGVSVPSRLVALSDASDLTGGTLLPVTLRSRDGRFRGVASGSVSVSGSKPLALAPASAVVEQALSVSIPIFITDLPGRNFVLGVHGLDAVQLRVVAGLINRRFGEIATAHSGCDIEINLPSGYDDFDERASLILNLALLPVHEAIPALLVDRVAESLVSE